MARSRKNLPQESEESKPFLHVPSLQSLQIENEQLKIRVEELVKERDAYRSTIYAWAREQFSPEDFRRVAAEQDRIPLIDFISELQDKARGQ